MAKILIVDDRAPERELLAVLLKYARHDVIEAANTAEALRLVKTERPHLVISDVLLPDTDGYEFVRQLRTDPSTAGTAVIFYTAVFNEHEAKALARDCGVVRVLSKPTEPQKILDVVTEVLCALGSEAVSPLPDRFEDRHQQLLIEKLMQQVDALRQSEERFRLLAEHATDMVFRYRLQPTGRWEYVNPAAKTILGFEPQEFYDHPELLSKIVHPESLGALELCISGKCAPGGGAIQLSGSRKDGKTVWAEIRCATFYDDAGRPMVVEGIARDITESRQAFEEIKRSRNGLEARMRERTRELAIANKDLKAYAAKLERINLELQEFAFVASHDLQEPLRKIQTFGDRLKAIRSDSSSDASRDYLERITRSAKRMSMLLQALLDYSQIATKPTPSLTDLAKVAGEAVSDLEVLVEQTGARVEIGELPVTTADPNQMRQLFQNLIGNAIKYCESGEKPYVKIYGRIEEGMWRIFVEDNGIGFDERYLDRIFRPFQRLHGKNRYEGTGMGLAICRKVAERQGGTITAKSAPGKGSTFIVTLPLRQIREDLSGMEG